MLLFLLLLLDQVATVTPVTGCHSGRNKDDMPSMNCQAAGLTSVPTEFDATTQVLLFPNNLFSSLAWSSFQIYPEIFEIDLTGNKVPEVTPSDSPILPTLIILRLGSNRLTSLSDHSFSACPALVELYLQNNSISSLSDHTFSGLQMLQILDLSTNRIKVLPGPMLYPLRDIETLYIEDNKITIMPDGWFNMKDDIPYLYVTANPWDCTCANLYLHSYIQEYDSSFYVRDGIEIKRAEENVVCRTPAQHRDKPVMHLEESDLCPREEETNRRGDFYIRVLSYETNQETQLSTTTLPPPPSTTTTTTTLPPPPSTTTTTTLPPPPSTTTTLPPPPSTTTTLPPPPSTTTTTTLPPPPTTTTPTLPPPPPPTTTTTTLPPPPPPTTLTTAETSTALSWHLEESFTDYWEFDFTESEVITAVVSVNWHPKVTDAPLPIDQKTTETPTNAETSSRTTPLTTKVPSNPPWSNSSAIRGTGLFCFWLFASFLLLCVASVGCILATLWRLIFWYRRIYKPMSVMLARSGAGQRLKLSASNEREGKEVEGGGGVMPVYRSVLYIHKEGAEATRRQDTAEGGEEGREGDGGKETLVVTLKPTGGEAMREDGKGRGREERGLHRKSLFRMISREEETEGWRDVVEECPVSAKDGGRRGGGEDEGTCRERSGGMSKKRYSVILREEREGAG